MKTLRLFPTVRDSHVSLHSEMMGTLWRPKQPLKREVWSVFPTVKDAIELGRAAVLHKDHECQEQSEFIKIGGFHNIYVPTPKVETVLYHLKPGWFASGHMPFTEQFEQLILKYNFRMVLIFRDPRDVINSELNFFLSTKKLVLHDYYKKIPKDEGVMSILNGLPGSSDSPHQPSIRKILEDYMSWISKPYVHVTKFEDLVGPQGGGDAHKQTEEINNIAAHLELSLSEQELNTIKKGSFGGTHTFRKGTIGSWKEKFTPAQKLVCKELIGDLLIDLGYEKNNDW